MPRCCICANKRSRCSCSRKTRNNKPEREAACTSLNNALSARCCSFAPKQTLSVFSLLTDDICGDIYCCLILLQAASARVDLLLQNGADEARQQETLPFPAFGWNIYSAPRASPATHYGRDMIYCIYRDVCAAPKSLFLRALAQTTLSTACQFLQRCRKFASWNQNLNEVAPGSSISSGLSAIGMDEESAEYATGAPRQYNGTV
jgi:hypothetical protein